MVAGQVGTCSEGAGLQDTAMTVLLFVIGYAFFHPRIRIGQRLMELPFRSVQPAHVGNRLVMTPEQISKRAKEDSVVSTEAIPKSERSFNEGPRVCEFSAESSCEVPQAKSKVPDSAQLRQRLL